MSQIFCSKCNKTLNEIQFYTYKDGSKCEQCKKCQTMHIDNYNPETFLWLLEKMDVPYIEEEWNSLRDSAAQKANNDHKPLTGMSVYGKYLSKMKLKQWKDYSWEDTERLRADRDRKKQTAVKEGKVTPEDELKRMFEEGEISEAEFKTLSEEPVQVAPQFDPYPINNPGFQQVDIDIDLDEEEKVYLALKWGRLYRPDQWISLEKMYNDMMESFDIQSAAREDTLKKICKVSLKMDEAIDCGDTDGFAKLSRTYDVLMKSGKFSEAQNKDTDKGQITSIGELVALCENETGFIPKYEIEVSQDIVDRTIEDMNLYVHKLITQEVGLGQQIEDAFKKIQIQLEADQEEEQLNIGNFDEIEHSVLQDADFEEFYEDIETQKQIDLMGDEE